MDANAFKYFAETPRRGQDKLCLDLHTFLRSDNKVFLFQGDTGLGKERAVASQAVTAIEDGITEKVFWLVPMDTSKINVKKELDAINAPNKKVLVLHNKDKLCNIKDKISQEPDFSINDIPEKLHKEMHEKFGIGCPYYDQLDAIPESNIIVSDYNYVIDTFIMNRVLKIKNENNVVIFNEVHMLPDRARDVISQSISSNEIEFAIKEIEEFEKKTKREFPSIKAFLGSLRFRIEHLYERNKTNIESDKFLGGSSEGKSKIAWNEILEEMEEELVPVLESLGTDIIKWKIENKIGARSWCFIISRFLSNVYFNKDYRYVVYFVGEKLTEEKKERRVVVGYQCLDPYPILKSTLERFSKIILYSATLYPDRYIRLFRLNKFGKTINPEKYGSPFPAENRKDLFYEDSQLTKADRDKPEVIQKVSDELNQMIPLLQKPMLIFSVHPLFNKIYPNLKLNGFKILKEISGTRQEKRKEFMEQILQNDVTFLSVYGSFAQSIDLSGINSVVILGVPIAKLDMMKREMMFYFTSRFLKETGDLKTAKIIAYDLTCFFPAVERAVQCSGRPQRTEQDKVKIVWFGWKGKDRFIGAKNRQSYLNFNLLLEDIK